MNKDLNDTTFRAALAGFSTNQLKYELELRADEIYSSWRNNPETKCLHCKRAYTDCYCDYEDMSIQPPQPNTSPCSGDHVWSYVWNSEHKAPWVKNKYNGVDVFNVQCKYCGIIRDQWLRVKNPDKPHYYVAELVGEQTVKLYLLGRYEWQLTLSS